MARRVLFESGTTRLTARLRETRTADAIWDQLPVEAPVKTWGDEVYFSMPVQVDREHDAKEIVTAGEIAFWAEGEVIAIGYGETPISVAGEIRLAAPVNIWADAEGDVVVLGSVIGGDFIRVSRLDAA